MIRIEAVLADIEKIEKDEKIEPIMKLIAMFKVAMKFFSTMRSNQLLTEEDKKLLKKKRPNPSKK